MKSTVKSSLWLAAAGIIFIVSGIAVLAYPGAALETLALVLGISILTTGILQLAAFLNKYEQKRGWLLFCAIIDVLLGIFLLSHLVATAMALPFAIGIWALFTSIAKISAAIILKKAAFKNWWLLLWAGIVGAIISCLIIFSPVFGALFITAYISVFLIFAGLMSVSEAAFIRKISK